MGRNWSNFANTQTHASKLVVDILYDLFHKVTHVMKYEGTGAQVEIYISVQILVYYVLDS